jgi:hypothetical protein
LRSVEAAGRRFPNQKEATGLGKQVGKSTCAEAPQFAPGMRWGSGLSGSGVSEAERREATRKTGCLSRSVKRQLDAEASFPFFSRPKCSLSPSRSSLDFLHPF